MKPSDVAQAAAALRELRVSAPLEASVGEDHLRIEVLRLIANGSIAAIALAKAAMQTVDG